MAAAGSSGAAAGVLRSTRFEDFHARMERAFAGLPVAGETDDSKEPASDRATWVLSDLSVRRMGAVTQPAAASNGDNLDSSDDDELAPSAGGEEGADSSKRNAKEAWERDLDCLESDDEATEEDKMAFMRKCVGLCNALENEEEFDDSDRMALARDPSEFGSGDPACEGPHARAARLRAQPAPPDATGAAGDGARGEGAAPVPPVVRAAARGAAYTEVADDNVWEQRCRRRELAARVKAAPNADKSMAPPPPRRPSAGRGVLAAAAAAAADAAAGDRRGSTVLGKRAAEDEEMGEGEAGGEAKRANVAGSRGAATREPASQEKRARAAHLMTGAGSDSVLPILPSQNVPSHVKRAPDKWLCYKLDEPMLIGGGDKGAHGAAADDSVEMKRALASAKEAAASGHGALGENAAQEEVPKGPMPKPVFRPKAREGTEPSGASASASASASKRGAKHTGVICVGLDAEDEGEHSADADGEDAAVGVKRTDVRNVKTSNRKFRKKVRFDAADEGAHDEEADEV